MLQHADPDLSPAENGAQDSLRLEVEKIIAQRLERSALKRNRSGSESPPPADHKRLRKSAPPPTPDFEFDLDADMEPEPMTEPAAAADTSFLSQVFDEESADEVFERVPELQPLEPGEPEAEFTPAPQPQNRRKSDRRQGERRNVEFMRTELQWEAAPDPKEKKGLFGSKGFKPSRVILLALASLSAAVAVALMVVGSPSEPAPVPEPVAQPVVATVAPVPMTRILVAAEAIGAGQKLTPTSVTWLEMADADILPGFVSGGGVDEEQVLADVTTSIARYPLFPGDPIRMDKLLSQAQQSLASTLQPGMRGISVMVSAGAAAGGFIKPDDHVDVVLATDADGQRVTRTVLQDVRVLAINSSLGPQTTGEAPEDASEIGAVFEGMALATLELDPNAAEVLVRASAVGSLTLTLRPYSATLEPETDDRAGANQTIRLTSRFWKDSYSPGMQ